MTSSFTSEQLKKDEKTRYILMSAGTLCKKQSDGKYHCEYYENPLTILGEYKGEITGGDEEDNTIVLLEFEDNNLCVVKTDELRFNIIRPKRGGRGRKRKTRRKNKSKKSKRYRRSR